MAVERGKDWGELGALPEHGIVAPTDQAIGVAIRESHAGRTLGTVPADQLVPVGLIGGDLRRTLGGRRTRSDIRIPDASRATVDYGIASVRDEQFVFAAHVICRKAGWRGRSIAIMNAAFVGGWNLAPRAHPGDGKFDVLDANLSFGDRLKARKRLASGTHVPHPDITQSRTAGTSIDFGTDLGVWIDGAYRGTASTIDVRLIVDGVRVVV